MATTAAQAQLESTPRPAPDARADFMLSRDPAAFGAIFESPAVLPYVTQHGQAPRDLVAFFDVPENIGFLFDGAAFLAEWLEPGVYEVHSAALPHVRGRYTSTAAHAAIAFMFFATDAMELHTRVVAGNLAATALTRRMGFSEEFTRASAWLAADGLHDVTFYALRYPEWIKDQTWLCASGEWFHDQLGETATHDPDPGHDQFVGAAVEMIRGGQPAKGVVLYNRWARLAGYAPIGVVSLDPLTLNIVSHIVSSGAGWRRSCRCGLRAKGRGITGGSALSNHRLSLIHI